MAQPPCSVEQYYLGVDVGTASVRVALVTRTGLVRATAEEPIRIWEPSPGHYVQSSDDIWEQCCRAIRKVTQAVEKGQIRGIGFDATCSLVALDAHFEPVAVNRDGIQDHNIVMWMDHRASEQAARITATGHSVLRRMGGTMFLEMQPPKLLWLKENLRETCWDRAAHFMDLPDFLSWKATGSLVRSLCTLVCKWTYCPQDGWDSSFWTAIGLEDLLADNYAKIGQLTCCPGTPLGAGLTLQAAADTHLEAGTAVAASLVDAHAGGLGVIGADVKGFRLPCEDRPMTSRMALICGTSSCHMGISQKPLYVPGVWGPYFSAMVPGLWLNEGGQSATGKLIDHMVEGHTAFAQLQALADESGEGVYSYLNKHLETMAGGSGCLAQLSTNLHIWPDFHGNRSPLADPTLRGMVVGLTLSRTLDDLALLYLATLQAIALGTRHILQTMEEAGYDISTLFLCGGLSKNTLFVQTHADVTGLPIVLPCQKEAVLVGAAILGAYASHDYASIQDAMEKMAKVGKVIWPNPELKSFYRRKYKVFLQLADHQRAYASLMRN
ncbi:FGGY carbohydrate kinase domain-containing protein isoform X2 [Brienomyrus brachyistius]|nr:FGGY carbohydrate kinase domain-containing protein isoform X2 [Brienomyrus brachyistius]XP_048845780.1 FGGY carbohydrate kinase domain-containing protein isoform X2 [Brienomyrus brachyistius]XP_048845781.1 FGGY carbohydrate kinase domain-containing protein isoform X2 [Brienomyrus brachyistius]XP_048845782.1 FGGY carbohydrate kinase domain-containing protein isoform X2 [Brienomyrus brachyistius]